MQVRGAADRLREMKVLGVNRSHIFVLIDPGEADGACALLSLIETRSLVSRNTASTFLIYRSSIPLGSFLLVFLTSGSIEETKGEFLLSIGISAARRGAKVILKDEIRVIL